MSKEKKLKPLIEFDFIFYDEKGPSLQQLDDDGKKIGRPHCEVFKNSAATGRRFKAIISKPGRYEFDRFNIDDNHPYHLAFKGCRKGWFIIDQHRNMTLENID